MLALLIVAIAVGIESSYAASDTDRIKELERKIDRLESVIANSESTKKGVNDTKSDARMSRLNSTIERYHEDIEDSETMTGVLHLLNIFTYIALNEAHYTAFVTDYYYQLDRYESKIKHAQLIGDTVSVGRYNVKNSELTDIYYRNHDAYLHNVASFTNQAIDSWTDVVMNKIARDIYQSNHAELDLTGKEASFDEKLTRYMNTFYAHVPYNEFEPLPELLN